MADEFSNQCQYFLDNCINLNLRRLSRVVTSEFNMALRVTGLRSTQLTVLTAIGAADGRSMTEIAEQLSMDISTLSRSLDILEDKMLIQVERARGRQKRLYLTTKGKKTLADATPVWEEVHQRVLERFPAGEELLALMRQYSS